MKIKMFGREISFRKSAPDVPSTSQIRDLNPAGPLGDIFYNYVFRKVSGDFYEKLREGIPIIDAAIRRLISLNGTIKIIGDNMDCVKELEDFNLNVPVNDTQKGIHAFLENASNETFEQGFSISEFVSTPDMKDIAGLRVADSKYVFYRRDPITGFASPWYRYPWYLRHAPYNQPSSVMEQIIDSRYSQMVPYLGINEVPLDMSNKLYFSINNENTDPHGVSIMRSMEFCSQVLVTLQNQIKNTVERFGDPMYHAHYKSGDGKNIEERRKKIEDDLSVVIGAKRSGRSGDIVTAGGPNSEVSIKVIGHDGQIFNFEIPLTHVLQEIVSKTGLPAWLLGVSNARAQGFAQIEIEAALSDSKIRQLAMLPEFIRLFSTVLKVRGRKWKSVTVDPDKPGDWGLIFETPNIRDVVAQAQARFLNAQADQMQSVAGQNLTQTHITVGATAARVESRKRGIAEVKELTIRGMKLSVPSGCGCGKSHEKKETQRPQPWPELDKATADYLSELQYDWGELQKNVFTILKLSSAKEAHDPVQKGDIPSFSYTDEQIAAIKKSLKGFLDNLDPSDPDSSIRWAYGQAASLGYMKASAMLGKDRTILNIARNKESFDALCNDGFDLVKNDATTAIEDDIISAMERHMLAGSSPVEAAQDLEKLFGNANSDWDRLAGSEMSMAAEDAKKDEWKQWELQRLEFVPAPGACALCVSFAGDYPIDQCPTPVRDTHPRCLCARRPAISEVHGEPGS